MVSVLNANVQQVSVRIGLFSFIKENAELGSHLCLWKVVGTSSDLGVLILYLSTSSLSCQNTLKVQHVRETMTVHALYLLG